MIGVQANRVALVTGASGALGRRLVRYLAERHWSVRALVREATSIEPCGVTPIVGNLFDPRALGRATEGVDVVFHLAALRDADGGDPSQVRQVNVDGTLAVARAARVSGTRRFVYFSSTSVYGDTHGRTADESSKPAPRSLYARTKLEAESIVLQEAPGGVVLRVAAVYGPHQRGNYLRLAALCRRGIRLVGGTRRTLVYETDAMAAALIAAEHERAPARIFNVTDGMTHTLTAITGAMASALGTTVRMALPTAPVRALARLTCGGPRRFRPLLEDSAVEGHRIQVDLGFTPAVPLEHGWQITIDAWRAQGLL